MGSKKYFFCRFQFFCLLKKKLQSDIFCLMKSNFFLLFCGTIFLEGSKKIFLGGQGGLRREGGRTNERPITDHVISGPMRGLKKPEPNGANILTDRHTDMAIL